VLGGLPVAAGPIPLDAGQLAPCELGAQRLAAQPLPLRRELGA
jgi:hypothetical protein